MFSVTNSLRRVLSRVIPNCCLLCGGSASGQYSLCEVCGDSLPKKPEGCRCCGLNEALSSDRLCVSCISHPPLFRQCHSPYLYQGMIRQLVRRFKFQADFAAGRVVSELLNEAFLAHHSVNPSSAKPNLIIPAPIHSTRLAGRGFNQAELIAKHLGNYNSIPITNRLVIKTVSTSPQADLNHSERCKNLKKAFSLGKKANQFINNSAHSNSAKVEPLRIAIIDDVATTQATVRELSHCLKQLEPEWIDIWTIAQTPNR